MNILMIACGFGKLVDALLVNLKPISNSNFLTNIILQLVRTDNIAHITLRIQPGHRNFVEFWQFSSNQVQAEQGLARDYAVIHL